MFTYFFMSTWFCIWIRPDPKLFTYPDPDLGSGQVFLRLKTAKHYIFTELFFFPIYFYGFLCICTTYLCRPSEASTRYCVIPGGYPLRADRVCHVLGRSWIRTQDYWFAVRCATIEPPLLLNEPPLLFNWATSPPFEPPLLLMSHLSSLIEPPLLLQLQNYTYNWHGFFLQNLADLEPWGQILESLISNIFF